MKKIIGYLVGLGLIIAVFGLFNLSVAQSPDDGEEFAPPPPPKTKPRMKEEEGNKQRERFRKSESDENIDVNKIKEFLKDADPKLLEHLQTMKEDNPEEHSRIITRVWHEMKMLERLKKENPELYELTMQSRRLDIRVRMIADEYRKAEDSKQKETLKKELKSTLTQLFDTKMGMREKELKQLEEKAKKQREKIDKQKKDKDRLVEERLSTITGERDDMDW
jgi:hypothetical protein